MKCRIGVHVSIAGGLDRAPTRARELGCSTMQIFSHNPRGWGLGSRDEEEVGRFRTLRQAYDIYPVYIHTSYLVNLASARAELRRKSIAMVAAELDIADQLNAEYVVLHTGSASGEDPSAARRRAAGSLREIAGRGNWKCGLLLENTAGERGDITSRIHELAEIMDDAPGGLISGICLDTCHAYAAGYDIAVEEGIGRLAEEIVLNCGRGMLKLIHCNDSKKPAGSGVDRHEHIGRGFIGRSGISSFINHSFFSGIPLVLETPKVSDEDDRRNLGIVRNLLKRGKFSC